MAVTPEQLKALIAAEFPLSPEVIYLNHAGVGPWPARSARAACEFASENAARGAQRYPRWLEAEQALRERLRALLNAPSSDDVALVKNTSEALSMVAYGLDWQAGDNVVISDQEFPSNRIVWESLARYGVQVRRVDLRGGPSPEDALVGACDRRTRLLSISSVQYATGLRMDLPRLGEECRQRGLMFCVDAIQSLGALPMDVQAIQADFVMADGHKWLLGPEGLGVFYCRADRRSSLSLVQFGWHMVEHHGDFDRATWEPAASARRFECGSPNMLGVHTLNASLSLLDEVGMDAISRTVLNNNSYLIDKARKDGSLEILSPTSPERYAGIFVFRIPGAETQALYKHLMDHGVVCAPRGGGIRLSPHFYTPTEKLDAAVALAAAFKG